MKIILLLQRLNNLLKTLAVLLFFVSKCLCASETEWEVAVVFRGAGEAESFQKDIDKNILELARTIPGTFLKLGLYRESDANNYAFIPNPNSSVSVSLSQLLYRQDLSAIKAYGSFSKRKDLNLKTFLKSFYKNPNSKKALIFYSHGLGPDGLKNLSTKHFKEILKEAVPHLNLLWFDACFMANMEFLYELRKASEFTIASEEAEFTAGLPFQNISLFSQMPNAREAALLLARDYIDSYSYLKSGNQRNYVHVSSATISIIENKKLDAFAVKLKEIAQLYKSIPENQKIRLNRILSSKASMDDKTLIDLGHFLIELRALVDSNDKKITELIRLLNINAIKSLKTNPRITISSSEKKSHVVYGFNHWKNGHKQDYLNNSLYSVLLKNDGFVSGPENTEWPFKTIDSLLLHISPFAPGVNTFNYYLLSQEGKKIGPYIEISRTHDVVESFADSLLTPLMYTAYTQQIGTRAERYTGLNISIPSSIPSLDYYELEFNQLADWLSL